MSLKFYGFSEVGPRRQNEDAILLRETSWGGLFAVADGLGGHGGGDLAAKIAIDTVGEVLKPEDLQHVPDLAHRRILEAQAKSTFDHMASTLTAIAIADGKIFGVHVGDTRCVLNRGSGIKKLTELHTEAQRFLDAGKISKREFLDYPRRNIVESALGMKGQLRVQNFVAEVIVGDKIVLSTDGVHEIIRVRKLLEFLKFERPDDAAEDLKDEIQRCGAEDNYSAVFVFIT